MNIDDYELFKELGIRINSKSLELIHGNILLDDFSTDKMSFVSNALDVLQYSKVSCLNIFSSAEICEILGNKFIKQSFLPCRFFHEISLGKLKVELLPTGDSIGSSALFVKYNDKTFLFVSSFSLQTSSVIRNLSLKEVDYLIIKTSYNYNNDNIVQNNEILKLINMAKKLIEVDENLIVITNANGEAQRIAEACIENNIPIICSENFFNNLKNVDKNISLNNISPWLNKIIVSNSFINLAKKGIILVSKYTKAKNFPPGIWVKTLNNKSNEATTEEITISATFDLNVKISNIDYFKLYNKVKPKKTYVYGINSDKLCKYLLEQKITVKEIPLLKENSIFG